MIFQLQSCVLFFKSFMEGLGLGGGRMERECSGESNEGEEVDFNEKATVWDIGIGYNGVDNGEMKTEMRIRERKIRDEDGEMEIEIDN